MKFLFSFFLFLWVAVFPFHQGFAQVKPSPGVDLEDEQEIKVSADHMVQERKKDTVRAWGNVVIQFQDRTLKADTVTINNKTGVGEAKGNVKLTSKDGTVIKSERSLFNTNTKRGVAYGVVGKIQSKDKEVPVNYYFRGKEIRRYSPVHYKLKDSFLTTCEGKVPDWSFKADKMDLMTNDRALFTHGVFKVRNIPILYLPVGYVPINRERKSGFLIPGFGSSNTDGISFKPIYYWAINKWSDATIGVEYLEKRGVRPDLEYRYRPSKNTEGKINGKFLDDDSTGGTFYKVDWTHDQILKKNARLRGKLDIESDDSFNKTFEDNTNLRTRRNSDSFASFNKSWANSTFDILTRYRESTEDSRDDLFAQLPQVTYQHQRQPLGKTSFFFNQETSFSSFLLDLQTDPVVDDDFKVQRFDFHPQISRPIPIAPWLSLTPTVGWRETIYSQGLQANTTDNQRTKAFSRELLDINAALSGPKFNKIFVRKGNSKSKIKHLIEPRVSYDLIPDIDTKDRNKIRNIDIVDDIQSTNKFTYSLTQRLLRKDPGPGDSSVTREILRFDVSQSYDFQKSTKGNSLDTAVPDEDAFSEMRFDLDSRLFDGFLLNSDATFDFQDNTVDTFNFEVGVKPLDKVSLFVERRFIRDQSTFLLGSIYWAFKKGWQIQATTRYDELTKTFRENDVSLLYDNPCKCWGFSVDFINRDIISGGVNRKESKFLFTLTLRGIGTQGTGDKYISSLHRRF